MISNCFKKVIFLLHLLNHKNIVFSAAKSTMMTKMRKNIVAVDSAVAADAGKNVLDV